MNKILVPIDFSETSINAAKFAFKIAQQTNSALIFFHAYRLPLSNTLLPEMMTSELIYEKEHNALKAFQKSIEPILLEDVDVTAETSLPPMFFHLKYGMAVDLILNEAKKKKPIMIVMGTKGADDILDRIFGSVTANVIKQSDIPVLAIPNTFTNDSIQRMAYATNFDLEEIPTLANLFSFAKLLNNSIEFVHIGLKKPSTEWLKQVEEICELSGNPTPNFTYIDNNNIIDGIEHYLQNNHVDVLAILTHHRNLFQQLSKASITQKLALKTHTPLMAYH